MKYLIVYSHPNPASFNHAIKESVKETLEKKGHEVVLRDLYQLNFQPVLKSQDFLELQSGNVLPDVKTEQKHITWAEVIIFIHPVWWTGLPAMIKGYVDRVFTHGFAFAFSKEGIVQKLTGKKVIIFNTCGTPSAVYEGSGMFGAMKKTSDTGIFEFCGVEVITHKFFGAVTTIDDKARKGMLEEVKAVVNTL